MVALLTHRTKLLATCWEPLGQVHGADSLSNHVDHVFFASDLTDCEQRLGPGEADLEIQWVSFDEALDLVLAGELPHAGSSYAVLLMAVRRNHTDAGRFPVSHPLGGGTPGSPTDRSAEH